MIARTIERLREIAEISRDVVKTLPRLALDVRRLQFELDMARSRADLPPDIVEIFASTKMTADYKQVFKAPNPTISVCMATYNRSELLLKRALRSLLAQSYKNLQIVVVGDACTDDTASKMATIRDSRVHFVNLPQRGKYPTDPNLRWMVAGTQPINHALALSEGSFITHLDDDDEHHSERIEKLVAFAQQSEADLVYHPFEWEIRRNVWRTNRAYNFRYSQVTSSSIFYHHWLKRIPWDPDAYKYREPGDWNRLRKIQYMGTSITRFPEPLLRHYKERSQEQS